MNKHLFLQRIRELKQLMQLGNLQEGCQVTATGPELELALQVSRDDEMRDMLNYLEIQLSNSGNKISFQDKSYRENAEELANRLGYPLRRVSQVECEFSVSPEVELQVQSLGTRGESHVLLETKLAVGDICLVLTAFPFRADALYSNQLSIYLGDKTQLVPLSESIFGRPSICEGDCVFLVIVHKPVGIATNQLQNVENDRHDGIGRVTAYFNTTREVFGLLPMAPMFYFPSSNRRIAAQFGVRNSPRRVRQTILQYYDGLGDAISDFSSRRLDANFVKQRFRLIAKRVHPQFAYYLF